MKNNTLRNVALLLTVMFAFSSCASMKMGKKTNPYVGTWEYVVEELPVDIDGTCVITEVEGALSATLVNPMGEMVLEKLTIVDDVLAAELDADGTMVEFEGKFTGTSYEGFLFAQGGEFVMKMTKQE